MNAIVLDLDDTLIIIEKESYRPQEDLHLVLLALSNLSDTKLILWTHSTIDRVKKILQDLKIENYFDKIYTRKNCDESLKTYGYLKSTNYIKRNHPKIKCYYGIDDMGEEVMGEGYVFVHKLERGQKLTSAASIVLEKIKQNCQIIKNLH